MLNKVVNIYIGPTFKNQNGLVDFCPQDTLQVILKDIQIRDGDNNCMYNSDWMLTIIYRWIDD